MNFVFTKIRDDIVKGLISGKYGFKKDVSKNWACYFLNIPTTYVVIIGNNIYPISLEMIRLINEVKLKKLKYENGEFK